MEQLQNDRTLSLVLASKLSSESIEIHLSLLRVNTCIPNTFTLSLNALPIESINETHKHGAANTEYYRHIPLMSLQFYYDNQNNQQNSKNFTVYRV